MAATSPPRPTAAKDMSEACLGFLNSLTLNQKEVANYRYEELERLYWYYPPGNRRGLALRDMDEQQRDRAFAIIASGLADHAYEKTKQIINLETFLGQFEKETGSGEEINQASKSNGLH